MDLSVNLKLIDKITEPAKRARAALGGAGDAIDKLQATLKDTKAMQKNLQAFKATTEQAAKNRKVINDLNQLLKKKGKLTEAQSKKLAAAKAISVEYGKSLRSQSAALKKTGVSTKNLTASQAKLNAKYDVTVSKLSAVNKKLKRTSELRTKLSKAQKKLAIGGAVSVAGGLAVARGGASFLDGAIDFDETMSKVQALTRLNKESAKLNELREQAKKLGASTSFTATEVAQGQSFLAMAGFDAEKIKKSMPSMLDLAKGAGLDLATTADISSNILSAFKLPAEQMGMVADTLAATFSRSNVDLTMLGDSMKYVAPIAQKAGAGIQDAAAMAGLLGNVGIQGSEAGVALRALYNRMAAPPKDAAKALEELNVQVSDANGNMRPMADLLAEVAEKTKDMGNVKQLALFKAIAGARAGAAMSELVDQGGVGEITKFAKVLKNAKGEAEKLRIVMEDNFGGDIEKAKSAWSGLSISVFESNNVALREFIQSITNVISKLTLWAEKNPETIATLAKLAAGITALAVVGGTLAISIAGILAPVKLLLPALKLLGSAFTLVKVAFVALKVIMLANPIIAIITAIAAVAFLIYKNWGGIKDFFIGIWKSIKSVFYSGLVVIIQAVKKITSIIPDKFLPDSMNAANLDKTIAQYKALSNVVKNSKEIKDLTAKIDTTATQRIITDDPKKQPVSKVDVRVKIDSQAPATVEKVTTSGIADINLDVGNLATAY